MIEYYKNVKNDNIEQKIIIYTKKLTYKKKDVYN